MVDGNAGPITRKAAGERRTPTASAGLNKHHKGTVFVFRKRFVIALALATVLVGAWPAYRWWHTHRTEQFKTACKQALADKDWKAAETIATRWLAWDSANSDAWVLLADASVQLGDAERAAKCLGKVDDSYHGALQALVVRGDILFGDLNRVHEAVETWKRMLRINSLADVARQRLIYFYAMTFQRQKMLKHIRTAMQLHCEPPEAYAYYILAYEVNFSDGLSLLTKWRANAPNDETLEVAQAIYLAKHAPDDSSGVAATSLVAPGDLSGINECLQKYPTNLEVLAFHIDKAIFDGDEDRVLELLGRCPKEAEEDPRFWRFRGWYLAQQGRYQEAEQAVRKALQLHPVEWRARWLLASVLRRLGRSAEAEQTSRVALMGKELRRTLFELPNARALNHDLISRIRAYLAETGPASARKALEFRIESPSRVEQSTRQGAFSQSG